MEDQAKLTIHFIHYEQLSLFHVNSNFTDIIWR